MINSVHENRAKFLRNKRNIINFILFLTLATVVAEIYLILFNVGSSYLNKWGLVLILIELIILIYLAIKHVSTIDYGQDHDFSKNPLAVWSQIAATGLIGIAGIVFTVSNSFNESSRQQSEMATQLMSNREKSETDFRQNIFKPLVEQIFNDSLSLDKRFYEFELFQNNFNDLFNSRSLYDVLWSEAQNELKDGSKKTSAKDIMQKLINLAKYTNAQQELLISKEVKDAKLIPRQTFKCNLDEDKGKEAIILTLIDIDSSELKKDIRITLKIACNDKDHKTRDTLNINNFKPFNVSYFNSPLSDNFLMPDGDRIAVILEDVNRDSAFIRVIHFPADYVTVGYRPSISRVNELIEKKEKD